MSARNFGKISQVNKLTHQDGEELTLHIFDILRYQNCDSLSWKSTHCIFLTNLNMSN